MPLSGDVRPATYDQYRALQAETDAYWVWLDGRAWAVPEGTLEHAGIATNLIG